MIIPQYVKATSAFTYGASVLGKWYCSYVEECDGRMFPRYLHPDGWKRFSFWWDDQNTAERTFQKFNQSPLPVSEREFQDAIQQQADFEADLNRYS